MASDLQKKWEERLARAKKKREEWESEFRTKMGRDYFEGRQNPGYPENEWITVNKIYSHLQAQLPLLYSMDPYFYVKLEKCYSALSAEDLQLMAQGQTPPMIDAMNKKGRGRQAMLNYLKKELRLKEKARLGIQDAHFEFGVLKVRRASSLEKDPRAGKPIMAEDGKTPLKDPDSGEVMTYPDVKPANERYEWVRVHPCDILFDEDAGPLEESWSWLAHHRTMSKAEALAEPTFSKKAVKSAQGKERGDKAKEEKTGLFTAIREKLKGQDEKNENVFLDVWEVYDLKRREWLTFAEDADELLIEPATTPKGIERHPFSILRFTLRDNSPYPVPPVSPALDPQKEYSLSRSRLLTHRKRFNRKYEVVVNKLIDPDNGASKMESGDDGTMIEVQSLGAIAPIQDAPLDQQGLAEIAMLNVDLTEIMGTPSSARGVADADSATEASILDKRLEVREGDRLSMVVDWILDSAKKLDQLVQTHIDKDEAVKITGPQGEFWQNVREDDYEQIEGEFSYGVNLGASQPRLPEIERSQWIAFLSQVVIPFPHILTAPNVMKRMAEMFHIEDEAALEEFRQMGLKIMQGTMPMPGGQGGGPSDNPVAAIMGAAMGPMGGNVNGGGAPTVTQ